MDPQTGRQVTVEQTVAVEQWSARGEIAVRVEVVDSLAASSSMLLRRKRRSASLK